MSAVATLAEKQDDRAGYVDGYGAAVDDFAIVLQEPGITPGRAMKRVKDHLRSRLDPWLDDLNDALLPVFDDDAGAPAPASRQYRHAYMDGWDDANQTMAVLLDGCQTTPARALALAHRHVAACLRPWRDAPDPAAPKPAPLERVRAALQRQGIGVLCDVDIQAPLRETLGASVSPYRLLGVCDPEATFRPLELDPALGLSVLCLVALYDTGIGTEVRVQDPANILDERSSHELRVLVDRVRRRLDHLVVPLSYPEA